MASGLGSTQGAQIIGTTTNDSAAAGDVGEYVENYASASNAPTSNQYGDLTSITLTAGDWDVSGVLEYLINGATWSNVEIGITSHTGNDSTGLVLGSNWTTGQWASSSTTPTQVSLVIPVFRVSLASSTTYYLKDISVYTGGPPTVYGRISARRVR